MPLTREQACDVKGLVKEFIEELFRDDKFIQHVSEVVAKTVENRIADALETNNKYIEELKNENNNLCAKLDDLEQYTRRNNLRIFGVNEELNEDLESKVIVLFRDKMEVNLEPKDIDRVHRLGKTDASKSSIRPIIIKFTNYGSKRALMKSRSKLKNLEKKVYVADDLTKIRYELYRAAKKKFGNKSVWTLDGEIKVKVKEKLFTIKTRQDLLTISC